MKKINDFLIGADPELTLGNPDDENRPVNGGTIISNRDAAFGVDGNGITLEMRPDPSTSPEGVVNNLRDIFVNRLLNNKDTAKYNWYAGSCYTYKLTCSCGMCTKSMPMGGHIHFGIRETADFGYEKTVRILSQYLGSCLTLIDDVVQSKQRKESQYGLAHDYRSQTWGFEYRTPGSWLVSPYVAMAVLSLGKAVVWEVYNNPQFPFETFISTDDINKTKVENIRKKFDKIWDHIQQFSYYKTHKQYIDVIHFLVKNNLTWFPACSMKEAWGIKGITEFKRPKFSQEQIWSRYCAKH